MILTTAAAVSVMLTATPDLALSKLKAEVPGIRVHHHASDGGIDRIYGKPMTRSHSASSAASQFVADHGEIWNLDHSTLSLIDPPNGLPLMHDPVSGEPKFHRFRFAHVVNELPVFESSLTILVRRGNEAAVVMAAADVRDVDEAWSPSHSSRADIERAALQAARAVLGNSATTSAPTRCIFAGARDLPCEPRNAIEFIATRGQRSHVDYAKRRLVVDIEHGTILHEENMVLNCTGSILASAAMGEISGTVSARTNDGWSAWECDDTVTVPLPWAYVVVDGVTTTTDADGSFSADGGIDSTVVSELRGVWFDVNNDAGADEQLSVVAQDGDQISLLHNEEETELEMSQAVAYRDANDVRDWILAINPEYPTIGTQTGFPVNVNSADTCNAFYDYSSINFFQSGGGCNNTAFGHVVYHEYGHHLIAEAGSGQGEYGEGMSDCIGLLMTEDPVMAPGFFQGNCVSGIRTADNACQFQESGCSTCGSQIHACGQLISGCVWDTWGSLQASNPLNADSIIQLLTVNSILLHTGTGIDEAIAIDFVTLDDDDGDINNGSPNYDSIDAGFGAHGIDVPPIAWLAVGLPDGLPENLLPNGGTTMRVNIADQLGSYLPNSAKLAVSIGGSTSFHPLENISGSEYQATFPDAPCGIEIPWYLWLKTTDNVNVFYPPGGPSDAISTIAAWSPPLLVFDDDSSTDQGWTVGGDATDGIWERAIPSGGNNRPATDCDGGDWCWLTENRTSGGDDVDGGSTTLTSPAMDASAANELSYCWWYRNIGGGNNVEDDVWVVNVSDDDGATWTILDQTGTTGPDVEGNWQTSVFDLSSLDDFELNNMFRIQFVASDLNETSRVEAAVDNIRLVSIDCSEQPCPADLTGDGQVGTGDILAVLDVWGTCNGCPADLDGNGIVNVEDLLQIISTYGPCP